MNERTVGNMRDVTGTALGFAELGQHHLKGSFANFVRAEDGRQLRDAKAQAPRPGG